MKYYTAAEKNVKKTNIFTLMGSKLCVFCEAAHEKVIKI